MRDVPVSLLDILPTVLHAMGDGEESETSGDGRALQTVLAGDGEPRALLLENPEGWALRYGEWKALAPKDGDVPLLFNLRTDPHERHPLADEPLRRELAARAHALRAAADQQAARWATPGGEQTDEQVLQRLRDLGYL